MPRSLQTSQSHRIRRIRAGSRGNLASIREAFGSGDLLFYFVVREVKLRYRQTLLGGLWAILQPVMYMAVFALFFGRLAKLPSDGLPYPLFALVATVAWSYVSNSVSFSSTSVIANTGLMTKVYFPRITVPLAPVIAGLLDLAVSILLLMVVVVLFGTPLSWRLLLVPFMAIPMIACSAGIGAYLAAVNVKYRDVKYVLPFATQLWMFASPVVYPTSIVPSQWQLLYAINPMVGIIEGLRALVFGTGPFPSAILAISFSTSILLLVAGTSYFNRVERRFADVI